jgi:hypothetical protein
MSDKLALDAVAKLENAYNKQHIIFVAEFISAIIEKFDPLHTHMSFDDLMGMYKEILKEEFRCCALKCNGSRCALTKLVGEPTCKLHRGK